MNVLSQATQTAILVAMAAGDSQRAICRRLGIAPSTARRLRHEAAAYQAASTRPLAVSELVQAVVQTRRERVRHRGPYKHHTRTHRDEAMHQLDWTPETILATCIAYYAQHAVWPKREDFANDPALPSKAVVHRVFGGTNEAVLAAIAVHQARASVECTRRLKQRNLPEVTEPVATGAPSPVAQKRGRPNTWTQERVMASFAVFYREHARWPKKVDLGWHKDLPAPRTIVKLYGSMFQAIQAAQACYPAAAVTRRAFNGEHRDGEHTACAGVAHEDHEIVAQECGVPFLDCVTWEIMALERRIAECLEAIDRDRALLGPLQQYLANAAALLKKS